MVDRVSELNQPAILHIVSDGCTWLRPFRAEVCLKHPTHRRGQTFQLALEFIQAPPPIEQARFRTRASDLLLTRFPPYGRPVSCE